MSSPVVGFGHPTWQVVGNEREAVQLRMFLHAPNVAMTTAPLVGAMKNSAEVFRPDPFGAGDSASA
jgi:hypothetical protein